jgi:rhamnosyl/mannosyltransferase
MTSIDAKLFLGGSGPMELELRELSEQIDVKHRVHFLGDISDAEKLACYLAADVFCMPSHLRSEAFGLSQVEAMASGLPVVSTRIASGVPFVNQDGVSGLTVPPESAGALAEAINLLLTDNDLRNRLAQGAQERARHECAAGRMCDQVMNVYDQVLRLTV